MWKGVCGVWTHILLVCFKLGSHDDGHIDHQFSNASHDPFFQMTAINHFSYYKINLKVSNLVHGNIQRRFLIH